MTKVPSHLPVAQNTVALQKTLEKSLDAVLSF